MLRIYECAASLLYAFQASVQDQRRTCGGLDMYSGRGWCNGEPSPSSRVSIGHIQEGCICRIATTPLVNHRVVGQTTVHYACRLALAIISVHDGTELTTSEGRSVDYRRLVLGGCVSLRARVGSSPRESRAE